MELEKAGAAVFPPLLPLLPISTFSSQGHCSAQSGEALPDGQPINPSLLLSSSPSFYRPLPGQRQDNRLRPGLGNSG